MINNESFVFYESAYKQVMHIANKVSAEAAIQLMSDLARFGLYGEWPDEDSVSFIYGFEQMATSISSAKDRHAKSKENGAKGGRPKVELDKDLVMLAYNELHNWEKVAARFTVSAKTLREKRKEWENEKIPENTDKNPVITDKNVFSHKEESWEKKEITGTTGRNLNVNVNVNDNVNAPLVPRSVGASPQTPNLPSGQSNLLKEKAELGVDEKKIRFNF